MAAIEWLAVASAVTPGVEATVRADAGRMIQVLLNLLANAHEAILARKAEGKIVVRARADAAPEAGWVRVDVIDDGPGIPLDARERVFERFHSLRPADEDFGGHSGLGLAIARTIIEAHDGRLTAHDRADGKPGARLVIELPAFLHEEETA